MGTQRYKLFVNYVDVLPFFILFIFLFSSFSLPLHIFILTMRVLIVNTSERTGGAAVAAGRLMEALNNHGVKAKMLVRDKQTDHLTVAALPGQKRMQLRFLWERFLIWLRLRLNREHLFEVDSACCGADITNMREFQEADIIHLQIGRAHV